VLRDRDGKLSDSGRLAAGFAAGITEALLIVTPFEVVKIRLQQQKGLAYDKLKYHVSYLSSVAIGIVELLGLTSTACSEVANAVMCRL
jgi:hypothetical protein